MILGADPARHHGAHAHRHPHADRVDDRQQALGQPDGGDRVGPQLGDPEDVGDGEDRLHHHLEHHRDGQEDDGARQRHGGQIAARPAERLAHERPEPLLAGRRRRWLIRIVRSAGWSSGSLRCCRREEPQIVTRRPPAHPAGVVFRECYPRRTRPAPSTTVRGNGIETGCLLMAERKIRGRTGDDNPNFKALRPPAPRRRPGRGRAPPPRRGRPPRSGRRRAPGPPRGRRRGPPSRAPSGSSRSR